MIIDVIDRKIDAAVIVQSHQIVSHQSMMV
jgi:hypothetical protein